MNEKLRQRLRLLKINEKKKSSIDRFGDDLTELIVSYLPIEDKFRFECLSKQIQSLVFNKQLVLRISGNGLSYRSDVFYTTFIIENDVIDCDKLEKIMRKMKKLNDIRIDRHIKDSKVLRVIADNCHHLRRLSIDWSDYGIINIMTNQEIKYFGEKFGRSLKSFKLNSNYAIFGGISVKLLEFLPNLVEFKGKHSLRILKYMSEESTKVLTKLKAIDCLLYKDNDLSIFDTKDFDNKCLDKLDKLCLRICGFDTNPEWMSQLLPQIGRFRRLTSLHIFHYYLKDPKTIFKQLRQLSKDCRHLKKLSFLTDFKVLPEYQNLVIYLSVFDGFQSLTSLSLSLNFEASLKGFEPLLQLRHLKIDIKRLSDDGFNTIGQSFPNLETISLKAKGKINYESIKHLSQLKELKSIEIEYDFIYNYDNEESIIYSSLKQICNNCLHLRRLRITTFYIYIIYISRFGEQIVKSLISLADEHKRIEFSLIADLDKGSEQLQEVVESLEPIPLNLFINITKTYLDFVH